MYETAPAPADEVLPAPSVATMVTGIRESPASLLNGPIGPALNELPLRVIVTCLVSPKNVYRATTDFTPDAASVTSAPTLNVVGDRSQNVAKIWPGEATCRWITGPVLSAGGDGEVVVGG